MKRFQVIDPNDGKRYGESDTLRGAKMIASAHAIKFDNGTSYKPCIYLSSALYEGAEPVSIWDGRTWEDFYPVFGEI